MSHVILKAGTKVKLSQSFLNENLWYKDVLYVLQKDYCYGDNRIILKNEFNQQAMPLPSEIDFDWDNAEA